MPRQKRHQRRVFFEIRRIRGSLRDRRARENRRGRGNSPGRRGSGAAPRPVGDELRKPAAERLGDVTIPADGRAGGDRLAQKLRRDVRPLHRRAIGQQKRGVVIEKRRVLDDLAAERAGLPSDRPVDDGACAARCCCGLVGTHRSIVPSSVSEITAVISTSAAWVPVCCRKVSSTQHPPLNCSRAAPYCASAATRRIVSRASDSGSESAFAGKQRYAGSRNSGAASTRCRRPASSCSCSIRNGK